ncbi:hypothetical protein [Butyrivibrio sp. AE2032]|uniref:hypothetical protein n=1 Tax=Butyrivibrio sp. AE2032 TaxID=1458463 RepID=UPI00054D209F|nr:hypothetical protein [Butyrivibrio sp. AE2032]
MGMSIEEVIKELNWEIKVHSRVIKEEANNVDVESDWMKHWESVIEAFNIAINTMRKYQKIKEIIVDWESDGGAFEMSEPYWLRLIREVVEDGGEK